MKDFSKPTAVSALDVAFCCNAMELMPAYKDIPEEFRNFIGHNQNQFLKWQQKWFYDGLKKEDISKIKPKKGVIVGKALRHLQAIQGSFEPQHEHKEAGVAYLASLWFETV